jgi:hypothetical protein
MQHAHVNAEFFLRSTSTLRIQPDGSGECAEKTRLKEDEARKQNWKRWGPYLSERQWGTIREDYSADGIRSLDIHVTRMKYIYFRPSVSYKTMCQIRFLFDIGYLEILSQFSGSCWDYFTHDQARSRAYRWGEDGLLGITDRGAYSSAPRVPRIFFFPQAV